MRRGAGSAWAAVLAVGVLAVGVLTGCGSGSGATTSPTAVESSAPAPASDATSAAPDPDAAAPLVDPAGCPTDEGYEAALGCLLDVASASLDDTWGSTLEAVGIPYASPGLEVYDDAVETGCGAAGADQGPFYCPADTTIYLQREFMVTAGEAAGAEGPYSGVIVLAHEWGHHVQQTVGVDDAFMADQEAVFGTANAASVRNELMADCFAGWWSAQALVSQQLPIEEADLEDALLTLAEVGDDFDAQVEGTSVDPDTFDHGTVDQRTSWLATGFDAGAEGVDPLAACDTFSITEP